MIYLWVSSQVRQSDVQKHNLILWETGKTKTKHKRPEISRKGKTKSTQLSMQQLDHPRRRNSDLNTQGRAREQDTGGTNQGGHRWNAWEQLHESEATSIPRSKKYQAKNSFLYRIRQDAEMKPGCKLVLYRSILCLNSFLFFLSWHLLHSMLQRILLLLLLCYAVSWRAARSPLPSQGFPPGLMGRWREPRTEAFYQKWLLHVNNHFVVLTK